MKGLFKFYEVRLFLLQNVLVGRSLLQLLNLAVDILIIKNRLRNRGLWHVVEELLLLLVEQDEFKLIDFVDLADDVGHIELLHEFFPPVIELPLKLGVAPKDD